MKHTKNSLAAFVGPLIVVVAVTVFIPAHIQAQAPPTDVKVVNTTSEPVPVTSIGTTNVRDLDNPARQPVHFRDFFTVPAGKLLVVEYISARVRTGTPCSFMSIELRVGGLNKHYFYPTYVGAVGIGGPSQGYMYGLSEGTRAYIDENRFAYFGLITAGGCSPSITEDFKFASGFLVDKQ